MEWFNRLFRPHKRRVIEVEADAWWRRRFHLLGDWSGVDGATLTSHLPPMGSKHPKVQDYVVTTIDLSEDGYKRCQYVAFVNYEYSRKHRYF